MAGFVTLSPFLSEVIFSWDTSSFHTLQSGGASSTFGRVGHAEVRRPLDSLIRVFCDRATWFTRGLLSLRVTMTPVKRFPARVILALALSFLL